MASEPFPWAEAMRFGLGVLRRSPDEFWAMTLPELRAAAAGLSGGASLAPALSRTRLEALMTRFPDARTPGSRKDLTDGG
jgi:uncharacterized phage protein (TIGR02216 family)